jgi:hypothetical protein
MTETTNVPLTASQIRFLLDVMMGAQLGITKVHAIQHGVDDNAVYNHLANCLPNHPDPTECW